MGYFRMTDAKEKLLRELCIDPDATFQELMDRTGIRSPNTIEYHVRNLMKQGLINRKRRAPGERRYAGGSRPMNHSDLCQRRSEYAQRNHLTREQNALALMPKKNKPLQKRIDEVVAKAIAGGNVSGPKDDVFYLPSCGFFHACKIG